MAKRFRIELGELHRSLRAFDNNANDSIAKIFKYQESVSEAHMKTTAPWTDDTGNARNGLFALATSTDNSHELLLSHSAEYGIYLETRNGGRFGVIIPSWRQASDDIWRLLRKLFTMMKKEA
jgi:hypothetical protein